MILLIGFILLLQIRPVQTYVTKLFLEGISNKIDHEIFLEKVQILWLDRANFHNFLILDQNKDTLIFAQDLSINYRIQDLLSQEFLQVQEISGEKIGLRLVKYDAISPLNFTTFLNTLRKDAKKKKSKKNIKVDEINIKNLFFSIEDETKERVEDRLDFSHLNMYVSDFLVSDLELAGDTVKMNLVEVIGEEQNVGFEVLNFSSELMINNQSLSLTELDFETPQSHVSDSVKLYYNGLDDLSHFVDSVSFGFYLSDTRLARNDLNLLLGEHELKSDLTFDGVIWGTVGDFNVEQSKVGFGKESFIEGGLSCFGLPNVSGAFALADITSSHIIPEDIEPYLGKLSNNVAQLGKLDFTGSFAGFLNDFVARGDFVTEKGSVHSDINLKIPEDPSLTSYSGHLELKNVDLGAFLGKRQLIQNVNLKGRVEGQGITRSNANFDLDAVLFQSGLYGYQYDTVRANGAFSSNFFKGSFSVNDPNCRVQGYADLDLSQENEVMKVDMKIDSSNLQKLNLVIDTLITGGKISLDIVSFNIDEFIGRMRLDSGFIVYNDKQVTVDSILFDASTDGERRYFKLHFPGFDAELEGKFLISDLTKDLSAMASDYTTKVKMTKDSILEERSGEKYKVDLFAEVDDLSRYLDFLDIPLKVSNGSFIEATFRESKSANISIYAQADFFQYKENVLYNPVIEINGSKKLGAAGILTNFIFESDRQKFSSLSETRDLFLEGVWFDDNVNLTTSIAHEETKSDIRIKTSAKLSPDSIKLKVQKSDIIAFDEEWSFNPNNLVTFYPDHIDIRDFEIYDSNEFISVIGKYSYQRASNLSLRINGFHLDKINLLSDANIDGLLNTTFSFFREASSESFQFEGNFIAADFKLNDFLVGDVKGESNWNPLTKDIYSKIEVDRENFKSIDLKGHYYPLNTDNQLDFDLEFDHADLRLLQPFLEENISNLGGRADGKLVINGTSTEPKVFGSCKFSSGTLKVNYLNTDYRFDGDVEFLPTKLIIKDLIIKDRKESIAQLGGEITHNSFRNISIDLRADVENFEFLNTTALDNSLYYGSAYGTGLLKINGPPNDLLIKASIQTNQDTRFFIPVSEGGGTAQQEYITFIDLSDSTVSKDEEEKFSFKGITLDFDIEVTPDAYCELIFDIKTGDIIRGRGRGNLKLTLDTDGEFHMFGPLQITEGAYNFTALGVVNKEFVVKPDSRITWFGDPYNAVIDLDAVYRQLASFEELEPQETQDKTELSNKVPINVLLNLDGNMLSPDIDFDLEISDDTDIRDDKQSKLAQIVNDEQELRRQVISLLFFKRFSPQSSFSIGGGGDIGNSVSEFFSSQVSYLVSQLDENLEVEVDLASLDKDAFNTFQLRLAYTFLDGRLTVTRGGGFSNQQDQGDQVLKDIVGDWSVEYSLTGDGRLRAKIFSTTNQGVISNQNAQIQDTGISLRFVHSFNDFREILSKSRENELKRRAEEKSKESAEVTGPNTIR